MKGTAQEGHVFGGFTPVKDGWHIGEFQEGIDYIKNKEGVIFQDDAGGKAWKFPIVIKDPEDEADNAKVELSIFETKGDDQMATTLSSLGMLKAVEEKFPGDVSPFDKRIMEGVKKNFPGKSCMIFTKQDKKGFARVHATVSFAQYKALKAEGKLPEAKAPAAGTEAGTSATGTAQGSAPAAPAGTDW
jgi:hypothetical protein